MANVQVKINSAGAREVMNSPEVQSFLLGLANNVASHAGTMGSGEYVADVQPGVNRAHARAKTANDQAVRSNKKHNSLVKGLGASHV